MAQAQGEAALWAARAEIAEAGARHEKVELAQQQQLATQQAEIAEMRGELRVALGKADRDGAALGVERRRSEGLSQRLAEAQAARRDADEARAAAERELAVERAALASAS